MNSENTCSEGWVCTMLREPGTLHKLQLAQNVAARFLMKRRRQEHIWFILKMYWLPVKYHTGFEIALLVCKVLHSPRLSLWQSLSSHSWSISMIYSVPRILWRPNTFISYWKFLIQKILRLSLIFAAAVTWGISLAQLSSHFDLPLGTWLNTLLN